MGDELTVNPASESVLVEYFYSEKSYEQLVDELARMVAGDAEVRHLVDDTRRALSEAVDEYNVTGNQKIYTVNRNAGKYCLKLIVLVGQTAFSLTIGFNYYK